MNDKDKPGMNIRYPQDNIYGLGSDLFDPDLRNLYDQNVGTTNNKVILPPANSSQASMQIKPGVTPNEDVIKDGDMWIDTYSHAPVIYTLDGTYKGRYNNLSKTFYQNDTRKSITGTSAGTLSSSLAPHDNHGEIDLIYLNVAKSFKVTARGILTTTALTNLRIQISWSSTIIFDTGNFSIASGITNRTWTLDFEFRIDSLDPSGAIDGQGYFQYYDGTNLKFIPSTITSQVSVVPLDGGDGTIYSNVLWSVGGNTLTVTNSRTEIL